jgi:t-SNARE complex subunit (syntaxin)
MTKSTALRKRKIDRESVEDDLDRRGYEVRKSDEPSSKVSAGKRRSVFSVRKSITHFKTMFFQLLFIIIIIIIIIIIFFFLYIN